jgi:hypothetical protein
MKGITIPNIITTLAGTIIAPTTMTIIIVGIIGGTIGGIGIDRRRRSGAAAPGGDATKRQLAQLFQSEGLGTAWPLLRKKSRRTQPRQQDPYEACIPDRARLPQKTRCRSLGRCVGTLWGPNLPRAAHRDPTRSVSRLRQQFITVKALHRRLVALRVTGTTREANRSIENRATK